MRIEVAFLVLWLAAIVALFLDWRVWRGDGELAHFQLSMLTQALPLSARTAARVLAARLWADVALFAGTTGSGMLLFGFPRQLIVGPLLTLFFLLLAMAAIVAMFGRPRWAIPLILRDRTR